MSQAKFAAAKELIIERQYQVARAVLETIDDPKADQWLANLDKIAPPTESSQITPLMKPSAKQKSRLPVIVLLLAIGALIVVAVLAFPAIQPIFTGFRTDCHYSKEAKALISEFLDTADTAASTARIGVSGLVVNLQSTKRKFEQVDHPSCLKEVTDSLDSGMGFMIENFQDFSGQNDFVAEVDRNLADEKFKAASTAAQNLGEYGLDYRAVHTNLFIFGITSTETPTPGISTEIPIATQAPMPTLTPLLTLISTESGPQNKQ